MADRDALTSGPRRRPCSKLRGARRGRVGKLKIFVGAAPGVGKTYEMLQTARARKQGRLRCRRRRRRDARPQGNRGAARRPRGRPAPAHRVQRPMARGNGPRRHHRPPAADRAGRRARPHQRARQPPSRSATSTSKSCSSRGIDVYTTVNIQHIESLNDVVAQITACARARDGAGFASSIAPTPSSWSISRPTI